MDDEVDVVVFRPGIVYGETRGIVGDLFAQARDKRTVAIPGTMAWLAPTGFTTESGGPDAEFSLEPAEFARLVADCKDAWTALGRAHYDVLGSDVLYDFRGVDERDEAAHATLVMLAHKFREFGQAVSLPELLSSVESAG